MMKWTEQKLSRQFGLLIIVISLVFCLAIFIFMLDQNQLSKQVKESNHTIELKEETISSLDRAFNNAIIELRGYFAYGSVENQSSLLRAKSQMKMIEQLLTKFELRAISDEDKAILESSQVFYDEYFVSVYPNLIASFEQGDLEALKKFSTNGNTDRVRAFQDSLNHYQNSLSESLEKNNEVLTEKRFTNDAIFIFFIVLSLLILFFFIRLLLKKIGKPLGDLTTAAEQISAGDDRNIILSQSNRKDEIGVLTDAFLIMRKVIQDKEQDLSAQNEELQAQQDELQAQQEMLEESVGLMRGREEQARRRNELINGIANTLDKDAILNSIVQSMSKLMNADMGFIVTLDHHHHHASFGVTQSAVGNFLNNIESGQIKRLLLKKLPHSVKREYYQTEMYYHEGQLYAYDLYIPILSSKNEVEAVMIFTRYSNDFSPEEMIEYNGLSKQIAISLDKIKMYEEAKEERNLTKDILNTINEGVQLVHLNGDILQMNEKFIEILGLKGAMSLPISFEDWQSQILSTVDDPEAIKPFLQQIFLENDDVASTMIYHQCSPEERVIQVYIEALYRGTEKLGTVLVHRDITKEHEVDQMKSEFVSTVSHELRTPLASILGFTELMMNKDLKPERKTKYLNTIFQEAERLTSLINDFLDVQKMESGRQTYEMMEYDLIPLLKSVKDSQAFQAPNHQIELVVNTTKTTILSDPDKLVQVFNNLLNNAIKYSPAGGMVKISVYQDETELKVAFRDEGLGIPEDSIEKLFAKFYRVDNSDRRTIGGTGLGLSIVKEIMKAHNGDIKVESKLGEGSTFTIHFPLLRPAEEKINDDKKVLENRTI